MPENKVRKYFSLVEVWAWCDICEDMVALSVEKDEIYDGLEMGIYTKEYKHKNPHPDEDDPDDVSGEEHTVYVYINENYDVTGVKAFFGDSPSMDEMEASSETGEVRIPVVVKDIPPMSVHLGMLTPEEYKVTKICDGMNTIEQVAEIAQKPVDEIEKMMEKLRKKGLIDVIKRG
ncbi:MAG: hypothetical protein GF383_08940 [Candidatus Lokiarchaeota archaeon]|nr:hypothetical protein [Candidatus Lokiarchaeota archaeon]MBD3340554.1 hypothetical protein [Candidatus Lokiarchaeota archaeon]